MKSTLASYFTVSGYDALKYKYSIFITYYCLIALDFNVKVTEAYTFVTDNRLGRVSLQAENLTRKTQNLMYQCSLLT